MSTLDLYVLVFWVEFGVGVAGVVPWWCGAEEEGGGVLLVLMVVLCLQVRDCVAPFTLVVCMRFKHRGKGHHFLLFFLTV